MIFSGESSPWSIEFSKFPCEFLAKETQWTPPAAPAPIAAPAPAPGGGLPPGWESAQDPSSAMAFFGVRLVLCSLQEIPSWEVTYPIILSRQFWRWCSWNPVWWDRTCSLYKLKFDNVQDPLRQCHLDFLEGMWLDRFENRSWFRSMRCAGLSDVGSGPGTLPIFGGFHFPARKTWMSWGVSNFPGNTHRGVYIVVRTGSIWYCEPRDKMICSRIYFCSVSYPIGSMGRTVYSPTFSWFVWLSCR